MWDQRHELTDFAQLRPGQGLAEYALLLGLIVIGAFGSSVISASIGVFSLYVTHVQAYSGLASAWLIYWLGDSTGGHGARGYHPENRSDRRIARRRALRRGGQPWGAVGGRRGNC